MSETAPDEESTEAAELSKLLWDAREALEKWADVVEYASGSDDASPPRRLVWRIERYRFKRGWSPDGFGGER